jgi:hypothetical protein
MILKEVLIKGADNDIFLFFVGTYSFSFSLLFYGLTFSLLHILVIQTISNFN